MIKRIWGLCLLAVLVAGGVAMPQEISAATTTGAQTVVYVSDFEVESGQVEQSGVGGLLNRGQRPGIIGSGPLGIGRSPQQQSKDIVELMSRSLIDDLRKAGIAAERLPPGAPLPAAGWLVRGVFLQADAGGRLRRAMIGFGAGGTEIQVAASIDRLTGGSEPQPLYTVEGDAKSRKLPGAVVTMNPYVAAARFVLAGRDLDRNVRSTADEIAKQVQAKLAGAAQ